MLVLEHDVDRPAGNRIGRWWAARGSTSGTVYLPLVMLDSGHQWTNGPTDYAAAYRALLRAALGREAGASVQAWAQRQGNSLRIWTTVTNLGVVPLSPANDATVNALVWEETRVGVTGRYVRAAPALTIAPAIGPGGTASFVLEAELAAAVRWEAVHAAVAVDVRPAGRSGPYDMLQAAVAAPPALTVTPELVAWQTGARAEEELRATVSLAGPAVVSWSAAASAPWLSLVPSSGGLPAQVEIVVANAPPQPGTHAAEVVFSGSSADGLALSCRLAVTVHRPLPNRPVRRRIPGPGGG